MSSHPNVILKCTIKAEGTTRKLLRDLLVQNWEEVPDSKLPLLRNSKGILLKHSKTNEDLRQSRDDDELAIGEYCYNTLVMEDTYDEDMQISGKEGDLIVYDLV